MFSTHLKKICLTQSLTGRMERQKSQRAREWLKIKKGHEQLNIVIVCPWDILLNIDELSPPSTTSKQRVRKECSRFKKREFLSASSLRQQRLSPRSLLPTPEQYPKVKKEQRIRGSSTPASEGTGSALPVRPPPLSRGREKVWRRAEVRALDSSAVEDAGRGGPYLAESGLLSAPAPTLPGSQALCLAHLSRPGRGPSSSCGPAPGRLRAPPQPRPPPRERARPPASLAASGRACAPPAAYPARVAARAAPRGV